MQDAKSTAVWDAVRRGDAFRYVFDLEDLWTHRCTVGDDYVDPRSVSETVPEVPLPYDGWGEIPDQRGHLWEHDDKSPGMPPRRIILTPCGTPPGRAERATKNRSTR